MASDFESGIQVTETHSTQGFVQRVYVRTFGRNHRNDPRYTSFLVKISPFKPLCDLENKTEVTKN